MAEREECCLDLRLDLRGDEGRDDSMQGGMAG